MKKITGYIESLFFFRDNKPEGVSRTLVYWLLFLSLLAPVLINGQTVNLGNLPNYLFVFTDAQDDANWQGATKGFAGDVAINGLQAAERSSGSVPYAGTIHTNAATLGGWQNIVDQNADPKVSPAQACGATDNTYLLADLERQLVDAIRQINALTVSPGYDGVAATELNGLKTQNGVRETFVINVTSGLNFSSQINITGDAADVFILRWDTDNNPANGYQGEVKPQSGGAIVPRGGLTPANFVHVAGALNAGGGGSTPAPPYPQGPRLDGGWGALIDGGSDFSGGGFFTGYWLTTGRPDALDAGNGLYVGPTAPLSDAVFVGGWYTLTTKWSLTSGNSGVALPSSRIPIGFSVTLPSRQFFAGETLVLRPDIDGGTPLYSFLWSTGATTSSISVSPDERRTYSVQVIDADGLVASASTVVEMVDTSDAGVISDDQPVYRSYDQEEKPSQEGAFGRQKDFSGFNCWADHHDDQLSSITKRFTGEKCRRADNSEEAIRSQIVKFNNF